MPFSDPEQNRERSRERSQKKTKDRQEIRHRLKPIADPKRRKAALASFRFFCEVYFRARFNKLWSKDHLKVIAEMEEVARKGGLLPLAMPRGTGKTSLTEIFCLWCLLAGLREFVLLVGSDKTSAVEMLTSIKTELESNELLAADFPREVGPFVLLEGEPRACNGQRYRGKRTRILIRQHEIVFATIPQSKASGAILRVAGITGRIRGAKFTRPDGKNIRPSLIVLDDPQTDKSAKSKEMTIDREKIITAAVKGLAGVGVRLGMVMPCTVIVANDLADRFLNPKIHPEARGVRTQMLHALPSEAAFKLWEEYRRIYVASRESGGDGSQATEFYREHQAAMDDGCEAAWAENYDTEEISAVQHAMNWLLFNPVGFWSECQNNPGGLKQTETKLVAEVLARKLRNLPRLVVPKTCQYLTAFIDVHARVLYYVVAAWEKQLGGGPIDYGTYPQQPVSYFSQDAAPVSMSDIHPGLVEDAWLMAGLGTLVDRLIKTVYQREDAVPMRIGRLFIDVKWGEKNRLLKSFCRRHQHAGTILWPAQGIGIGASGKPFSEYRAEPGAEVGLNWRIAPPVGGDRWVTVDTNFWKTFSATRLISPINTPGGWELFGRDPREHALFADHLCAEEPIEVQARGRTIYEWKHKPGRPDNHWWDCLVGSAVAASMMGCAPAGMEIFRRPPRRTGARVSYIPS